MKNHILFTDGSVHTQSGVGYGAYLVLSEPLSDHEKPASFIHTRKFDQASSSRLELQTMLWALKEIAGNEGKMIVYTDSQTIIGLTDRRARLEQKEFRSSKGIPLKNADLYREFYKLTDHLECEFVKVKGHKPGKSKDEIDRLFAMVDKAARKALRDGLENEA